MTIYTKLFTPSTTSLLTCCPSFLQSALCSLPFVLCSLLPAFRLTPTPAVQLLILANILKASETYSLPHRLKGLVNLSINHQDGKIVFMQRLQHTQPRAATSDNIDTSSSTRLRVLK